jgi:hypothetical protein
MIRLDNDSKLIAEKITNKSITYDCRTNNRRVVNAEKI